MTLQCHSWEEAGGQFPFQCKSRVPKIIHMIAWGGCPTHPPGCMGDPIASLTPAELGEGGAWSPVVAQERQLGGTEHSHTGKGGT